MIKTEFNLLIINFSQFEVSSFNYTEVSVDFHKSNNQTVAIFIKLQFRKATIYIIIIVLSFLLFIPFLGGKHNCLHARSRYK